MRQNNSGIKEEKDLEDYQDVGLKVVSYQKQKNKRNNETKQKKDV